MAITFVPTLLAGERSSPPRGLIMPRLSVQLAMGGTIWAPDDWVDVTTKVRQLDITRGRQHELSRYEAGTCGLTFTNQAGDFSPWNESGPYAGALGPGQPFKVFATWNSISESVGYNIFTGAVDSWTPSYGKGKVRADMVLKASDPLKMLSLAMANVPTSRVAGSVSLPTSPIPLTGIPSYVPGSGTVQVADSSGNYQTITYGGISGSDLVSTSGGSGTIAAGATVYFNYANDFSGNLIRAILLTSGIPSGALGAIATGTVMCQAPSITPGTTSLLSVLQQLENTEQGHLFAVPSGLLTFLDQDYPFLTPSSVNSQALLSSLPTDDGALRYMVGSVIPANDDLDLWNDVPVTRQSGTLQEASDAASIDKYGRRTLQGYSGMLQNSDTDAAALAEWLLSRYHLPVARVRQVALDNTADAGANLPSMLGLDLLDRVTVNWQPLDGTDSPFSQQSLIEKISHKITKAQWITTWGLSAAYVGTFLTLDDPALGKLDVNRLGP